MSKHRMAPLAVASILACTLAACGGSATVEKNADQASSTETGERVEEVETEEASGNQGQTAQEVQSDPFKGHNLQEFPLTLKTADGGEVDLITIADGKPLLVNMWATWCGYCVMEMPDLQELYHEYGDKVSFAFADFCDGYEDTEESVQAFLKENKFEDLPVYFDTEGILSRQFDVMGIPCTLIVDKDGTIRERIVGTIDKEAVRALLAQLSA